MLINIAPAGAERTCTENLPYAICQDGGVDTVFNFMINVRLRKKNIPRHLAIGRAWWTVEKEIFNAPKNQGNHFKDNYDHGKNDLCTV